MDDDDIYTGHHLKRKRKKNSKTQIPLRIKNSLSIPRLMDAIEAGRFPARCSLILTSGGDFVRLSVKKGIRSLKEQGRYGVFPLRKLLNVREASHKQIMEDTQIQLIKQIIGLEDGKVYKNVKSLRYCHLILMTNKDREGTLIKALFINFIHFFWPSLLDIPSFLVEVYTPNTTILKGMVTDTKKEAREWFQNHITRLRYFIWVDETDGDAIDMTFSEKIEERKAWIMNYETWVEDEKKIIRYRDFVTKELMPYSFPDMQPYIPSIVDGLNEVQRTFLYYAFENVLGTQIYISVLLLLLEHSAFHYDVNRLTGAIIGMVSDFVGSNNLNLFSQDQRSMFGTRLQGGKDHEDIQNLCTSLTPIARLLFPKEDDILYMNENGKLIQPTWYAPVLPLVLMNGCQEFGIGWNTFVPNYNPKELCANVRCLLNDEPMVAIDPWYKGFQGTIKRNEVSYTTSGKIECIDDTTLRITELPVHTWTKDYKEFLDTLSTCAGEMEEPFIKSYREHDDADENTVQFEINMSKENMERAVKEGLMNKFKLTSTISTDNMYLYDPQGVIKKYHNPEQILKDFYVLRLPLYVKRKEMTLKYLELELFKLEFKWEFITVGKNFTGWSKENVLHSLRERDLLTLFQKTSQAGGDLEVNEERFGRFFKDLALVDVSITKEIFKSLKEKLSTQVNELKSSSPEDLWRNDPTVFENELEKLELELKEAKEDREFWTQRDKEFGVGAELPQPVRKDAE